MPSVIHSGRMSAPRTRFDPLYSFGGTLQFGWIGYRLETDAVNIFENHIDLGPEMLKREKTISIRRKDCRFLFWRQSKIEFRFLDAVDGRDRIAFYQGAEWRKVLDAALKTGYPVIDWPLGNPKQEDRKVQAKA